MFQENKRISVFQMGSIAADFDYLIREFFSDGALPVQSSEKLTKLIEQAKQRARNKYPQGIPLRHVITRDGSHLIKVAVGGFAEDEIDISIENEKLYIRADYKEMVEPPELEYVFHSTLITKPFDMMVTCEGLDLDKIEAGIKNGILTIRVPAKVIDKSEQTRKKVQLN